MLWCLVIDRSLEFTSENNLFTLTWRKREMGAAPTDDAVDRTTGMLCLVDVLAATRDSARTSNETIGLGCG